LAEAGATGGVKFVFEVVDLLPEPLTLASQPITLPLEPGALTLQLADLLLLPLELFDQIVARGRLPPHAPFMPKPETKYKYKAADTR
jgi:hypothetical protein